MTNETNPTPDPVESEEAQAFGERDLDQPSANETVFAENAAMDLDAERSDQIDGSSANLSYELAESKKRELLAVAELENFRKRLYRESEQQVRFALMPAARDLISVLDNLERACVAADGEASPGPLLEGVKLVCQQMIDTLAKHNVQRIEALGKPFDPNFHEAISQAPSDEYESGVVMHEAATGYLLHDRIVRPSQVVVSTGPA